MLEQKPETFLLFASRQFFRDEPSQVLVFVPAQEVKQYDLIVLIKR